MISDSRRSDIEWVSRRPASSGAHEPVCASVGSSPSEAESIAHDLNNVLAILFASGEMALQASAEHPQTARYVEQMLRATSRLTSIVQRVQALSAPASAAETPGPEAEVCVGAFGPHAPGAPFSALAEGALPGGSEHVLVVDDDPWVGDLMREMLEMLGYRVSTADSGPAALELLAAASADYDLVISDRTMPEMDGRDLMRRIRTLRPDVPVILMSGFTDDLDAKLADGGCPDATLGKPFRLEEAAGRVRQVLDAREAVPVMLPNDGGAAPQRVAGQLGG